MANTELARSLPDTNPITSIDADFSEPLFFDFKDLGDPSKSDQSAANWARDADMRAVLLGDDPADHASATPLTGWGEDLF
jgi:hypothetical protein